jgi:methylmalonyl-CoA mutase N-terminal domain/subunit
MPMMSNHNTKESVRRAMAIQLIINKELGLAKK